MAKTIADVSAFTDVIYERLESTRQGLEDEQDLGRERDKLIAELRAAIAILGHRLDAKSEGEAVTTRALTELKGQVDKLREELAASKQENALLRQQPQDHMKQVEVWDNRRWGLFVLLIGAVLSLASGLIVTLARK